MIPLVHGGKQDYSRSDVIGNCADIQDSINKATDANDRNIKQMIYDDYTRCREKEGTPAYYDYNSGGALCGWSNGKLTHINGYSITTDQDRVNFSKEIEECNRIPDMKSEIKSGQLNITVPSSASLSGLVWDVMNGWYNEQLMKMRDWFEKRIGVRRGSGGGAVRG